MAQPNLSVIQGKKTAFSHNTLSSVVNNTVTKVEQRRASKNLTISRETLVELSNRLHSHLDIQELINAFAEEITPVFHLDDIIYQLPQDNTTINNKGRHFISYNLVFNDNNLGEMFFVRRTRFEDDESEMIEKFLISLLSSLFNAFKYHEVIQQAQTDPLTGALNRLGLERNFQREIDLARRNENDLSVLLIDIDHFKHVNDSYGHDIGDLVLKDMSKQIKKSIRATDVFSRFGGEEFIVLLNNTSRSGALLLAEKIRKTIEDSTSYFNDKEINYTTSIGVATLQSRDDKEVLFKRADTALYQAKNNGRNRVVLN